MTAKEHAGADEPMRDSGIPILQLDVDAEVWCALEGGCIQGAPGSHLFGPSCATEAEAAADG